jgi:hypothetical protein
MIRSAMVIEASNRPPALGLDLDEGRAAVGVA